GSGNVDVLHRRQLLPVALGADRRVIRNQAVGVVRVVLAGVDRGVDRRGVVDRAVAVDGIDPVRHVQIRANALPDHLEEPREEAGGLDLVVDVVLLAVLQVDGVIGIGHGAARRGLLNFRAVRVVRCLLVLFAGLTLGRDRAGVGVGRDLVLLLLLAV